jgi:hypothetical protein
MIRRSSYFVKLLLVIFPKSLNNQTQRPLILLQISSHCGFPQWEVVQGCDLICDWLFHDHKQMTLSSPADHPARYANRSLEPFPIHHSAAPRDAIPMKPFPHHKEIVHTHHNHHKTHHIIIFMTGPAL